MVSRLSGQEEPLKVQFFFSQEDQVGRVFKPKLKILIVTKEPDPRMEGGQKLTPRSIRNQNLISSTKIIGTFIK